MLECDRSLVELLPSVSCTIISSILLVTMRPSTQIALSIPSPLKALIGCAWSGLVCNPKSCGWSLCVGAFDASSGGHRPLTSGATDYHQYSLSATATGDLIARSNRRTIEDGVENHP